ncbi:MAG: MFS transporter [Anaerolineae bacterium]
MEPEITYTYARRNQALLIADLVLFSLGLAFLAPSTVLPAFIRRLGGSPMAVGCLSLISSAGWMLPSLAASRIVRGRPLVKNLVLAPMVISRLVMVPLVGATAYLALRAPALAVVAVLLTYAFLIIGDGFCVGWYDLVAKAAPPEQRGRMLGLASSLSSLFAAGAGLVITAVLAKDWPFPRGNMLLLTLSLPFILGSPVAVALYREPRAHSSAPSLSWGEYWPRLVAIVKHDRRFVWITGTRWLAGVMDMAAPFYVLYALERLHMPLHTQGLFATASVLGGSVGGLLIGRLDARWGAARSVGAVVMLRAAGPLLALTAPMALRLAPWSPVFLFLLLFFLSGLAGSGAMAAFVGYLTSIAPEGDRAAYGGLSGTLIGVLGLLLPAPLLAGWLVQTASYEALFAVAAVLSLLALAVAMRPPQRVPAAGEP